MGDIQPTCLHCHIGTLQSKTATYAGWHNGEFVVVPGARVWVCDVCAASTYDEAMLEQLILLVGPATESPDAAGSARDQRPSDPDSPFGDLHSRRRA